MRGQGWLRGVPGSWERDHPAWRSLLDWTVGLHLAVRQVMCDGPDGGWMEEDREGVIVWQMGDSWLNLALPAVLL
jgi:hypothetical protein